MKLNLLPTYVSKEKALRSAIVLSVLIALLSVGAAVGMIITSQNELQAAKDEARQVEPAAAAVVALSKQPAKILSDAQGIVRNVQLAKAMNEHNTKYPDLYDEVRPYIPSFFRITSLSATPAGADSVLVTMTGMVQSYQQYADLMLAMMRIPGAVSVTRAGFTVTDPSVPQLTPDDQQGKPLKPGEAPVPDDPLERLDYFIAQGRQTGFLNTGNFGTGDPTLTRGAMPGYSAITVTVLLQGPERDLRVPDPVAELSRAAGTAPAGGAGAPQLGRPGAGGAGIPAPPGGGGRGGPPNLADDRE